ncbi:unnamed protein product [Urochloa humidicola]
MAGVVEVVASAWNDWALQALVLLSFTLQVSLLVLAELRRRIDSGVLRAVVWSVYMVADGTAIYVLGHLSVASRSPQDELKAFWAAFLLLHLGGQDNITAYAIEDNQLWLRHLQTLAVQVAAAAYVLYNSSILGGPPLLRWAAILMFLVGAVKYGERVWALRCAGTSVSGNNYRAFRPTIAFDRGAYPYIEFSDPMEAEDLLLVAHLMLPVPIDMLKGPFPEVRFYKHMGSRRLHGEEAYEMIEMQLSLLHEVFYTKAEVTHTLYGLCIRMVSLVATIAAFFLFCHLLPLVGVHNKMTGYGEVDVVVTHVLLLGAIVLEITSVLRATFSSWTCADALACSSLVKRSWPGEYAHFSY